MNIIDHRFICTVWCKLSMSMIFCSISYMQLPMPDAIWREWKPSIDSLMQEMRAFKLGKRIDFDWKLKICSCPHMLTANDFISHAFSTKTPIFQFLIRECIWNLQSTLLPIAPEVLLHWNLVVLIILLPLDPMRKSGKLNRFIMFLTHSHGPLFC